MSQGLKLFILGAGCSVACGYPLGIGIPNAMKAFVETLDPATSPKLIRCFKDTLEQFGRAELVDTFDTFLQQVDESRRLDNAEKAKIRLDARIAVSVLFLSKEKEAQATGMKSYREFLSDVFPGSGDFWTHRDSPNRVLTFNYDRLFEIAFFHRFGEGFRNYGLYGGVVLNSGLDHVYDKELRFSDAFSFLKLHGSVAFAALDEFNDLRHRHSEDVTAPFIADDSAFDLLAGNKGHNLWQPLIVFPHERHGILGGRRKGVEERYTRAVWTEAERLMARAEEIRIIGYSFAGIDRGPFLELLGQAKSCKRFVVQNPEATDICQRIGLYHSEWKGKLEPANLKF